VDFQAVSFSEEIDLEAGRAALLGEEFINKERGASRLIATRNRDFPFPSTSLSYLKVGRMITKTGFQGSRKEKC